MIETLAVIGIIFATAMICFMIGFLPGWLESRRQARMWASYIREINHRHR